MGAIERLREHLDLPAPPPVHITFCGRRAVTTGVVNMRLLMGDTYHHLVERVTEGQLRRSGGADDAELLSLPHSTAAGGGKSVALYVLCPSDGLPQGCYRVHEGGEYWAVREGGAARATSQYTSSQSVAPTTQATHADSDTASEVIDEGNKEETAHPASQANAMAAAHRIATAHRPHAATAAVSQQQEQSEVATQRAPCAATHSASSSEQRSASREARPEDKAHKQHKEEKRRRKEERHRRREERRQHKEEKRRRRREREASARGSSAHTRDSEDATVAEVAAGRSPALARAETVQEAAAHTEHVMQPPSHEQQQERQQDTAATASSTLHDMMDRTVERLLQAQSAVAPSSQPQPPSPSAPIARKRHRRRSISLTHRASAAAGKKSSSSSSSDDDVDDAKEKGTPARVSQNKDDMRAEQGGVPSMDEPAIYKKARRAAQPAGRASLDRPPLRPAPRTRAQQAQETCATSDTAAELSAVGDEATAPPAAARALKRKTSGSTTRRSPLQRSPARPSASTPSAEATATRVTRVMTNEVTLRTARTSSARGASAASHVSPALAHVGGRPSQTARAGDDAQVERTVVTSPPTQAASAASAAVERERTESRSPRAEQNAAAARVAPGGRQTRRTTGTRGEQEASRSPTSGSVAAMTEAKASSAAAGSVAGAGALPQESPALMFTPIYNSLAEEFSLNPSSASSTGDSDYLYE